MDKKTISILENGKNGQNCPFFVIFEVKKGPIYLCKFDFRKKELILDDDLGQKSRNFEEKKGQYTIVNLIFVDF